MKIRDRIKELRRVPAKDLVPHPENWRRHPIQQQKAMQAVLEEIGFAGALLTREVDGKLQIIDGHLRATTASDEQVPVLVLDVDENEARQLLAVYDPLASLAEADKDALLALTKSITFDVPDLAKFVDNYTLPFQPPKELEDPPAQIDKAAELQKKWGVKAGDVWEVGPHKLWCGDCRECGLEVSIGLLFTDPPYGIGWKRSVNHQRASKAHEGIDGDDDVSLRDEVLQRYRSIPGLVFGSFYAPFPSDIKQILVWRKPPDAGVVGSTTGFRRDAEAIFLIGPWPQRAAAWSSVLTTDTGISKITTETGHPHTKPVSLIADLLSKSPNGSLLDPFCGSGTTLVAAHQLNRIGYGVEIDPSYVAVTLERLSALGLQPRLVT